MTRIVIACGNVAWERDLVAACEAAGDDVEVRRSVDLTVLVGLVAKDGADLIVLSPAVRGFDEKQVRAVLRAVPNTVVLVDSIRPPWLFEDVGLEPVELAGVEFPRLVRELLAQATVAPVIELTRRGAPVTVFAGVSGGVGVTTLAGVYTVARPGAVILDANLAHPGVGVLVGEPARSATLIEASRELALTGSLDLAQHVVAFTSHTSALTASRQREELAALRTADVLDLIVAVGEQAREVVVDLGALTPRVPAFERWDFGEYATAIIGASDRLAIIADATPQGMVRLCDSAPWLHSLDVPVVFVVNRVRASAAGTRHIRGAITELVEREFGQAPVLIDDRSQACDRGWLVGDWTGIGDVLTDVTFNSPRAA